MAEPIDLQRDALFGNPPAPKMKPSREGMLAAFVSLKSYTDAGIAAAALSGTDLDAAMALVQPLADSSLASQLASEDAKAVAVSADLSARNSAADAASVRNDIAEALVQIPASVAQQLSGAVATATAVAEDAAERSEAGEAQSKAAALRATWAASTAESIVGPTYTTTALGLAGTPEGGYFAVGNGNGTVSIYRKVSGAAVFQRRLATSDALASPTSGSGLDLVGRQSVAGLLLSTALSRGVGAVWHADDYTYVEAEPGAIDWHVETADGVRLYQRPGPRGYDVRAFGAVPGGEGNDLLGYINKVNAATGEGGSIVIPAGHWWIDGTIPIKKGQRWYLEGAIIHQMASNVPVFFADEADNFELIGGQVMGTRAIGSSTDTGQDGLRIVNTVGGRISRVTCVNMAGQGFRQSGSQIPTYTGQGNTFSDCSAFGCVGGRQIIAGSKSEFSHWTNWKAVGNYGGDDISAGNTTTDGGSVSSNTTFGVRITGGANDGHGSHQNVTIAHNGQFQIEAVGVRNGYHFVNCRMYDATIAFTGCDGVHITGGILSIATIYNRKHSDPAIKGTNYIEGAWCPGGPINVVRDEAEHDPNLVIMGCTGPGSYNAGGVSINSPSPVSISASRNPGDLQTLTPGARLAFPEVLANGDFRRCLNAGKDKFIAREAGTYELVARTFHAVTDSTLVDSYLAVHVGDAATIDPTLPTAIFDTELMQFDVRWRGYLPAGGTLDIRSQINGTAPKFGHPGFRSWWTVDRVA